MFELRSILVRYGIHGWGEINDLHGIVIFATNRLKVREVVLSLPSRKLRDEAFTLNEGYSNFNNLDALVSATRSACNQGAANTLDWVNASNAALKNEQILSSSIL